MRRLATGLLVAAAAMAVAAPALDAAGAGDATDGADGVGYGLTCLALAVTALNAATGLCLGCKAYLMFR